MRIVAKSLPLAKTFQIEYFFHCKKKKKKKKHVPTIYRAKNAQETVIVPRVKKSTFTPLAQATIHEWMCTLSTDISSAPAAAGCVRADSGCGKCNPVHG